MTPRFRHQMPLVLRMIFCLIALIHRSQNANVVVSALTQQIGSAALNFARVVDASATASAMRAATSGAVLNAAPDTICRYCRCDASAATVHCVGSHAAMRLRVVRLPEWADTFRAANLTFDGGRLPRFAYHRRLRTIRMNFCQLRTIDATVFGALPSLETLDLADNGIDADGVVPLASLSGAARRLRVLNLARNAIEDIGSLLDWRTNESIGAPDAPQLDELIMSGNPLCRVTAASALTGPVGKAPLLVWPPAGHLALADANLRSINATHFNFGPCKTSSTTLASNQSINTTASNNRPSASLAIPPASEWRGKNAMRGNGSATSASALLDSVDLSDNDDLVVDGGVDALWHFANASTLKLRGATLPAVMFTRWLKAVPTHLRHLDVSGTRTLPPLTEWRYCAPCLEWLDLSGMALRRLELSAKCPIQWLYAEDNQIKEIALIDKASSVYGSSLRALHLGNNRLSAWPFPAPSRRAYSVARTSPPNTNLYAVTAAKTPTPPAVALMLDASAFPQLETLSLTANAIRGEIRAEDFGTLPALAHLDLSLNRLDAIFDTTETDGAILSPRLEFLNLSGNTIRRLSGRHWPNLPALSVLDLSGNRLDTFGSSDENTVSYEKQLSPNGYPSQLTASVGAGWYVASAGTWDPYGASGLFVGSNVGNDDARAAAGKRRVKDDVNSLLGRLPALQHLHLARNGRVPARLAQWLDGAGNASNPAAFCLVELDVAECGMPRQPDLSRLPHLTILHMAGNAFPTLDGTRLPPCAVSVDASRNGIERVQDIDDAQLACLRHLRLAENALRCDDADCTLHRLLPNALQQQDDFYDRTEYYCFTDDGWRHPLSAYLDAHATACQNYNTERTITPVFDAYGSERHHPLYHHYYGGGGRTRHPENAAFHFLGFLLVFIAVTLLILAVSLRAARWATRKWRGDITVSTSSAFAYKPVPQSAVSDADGCFDNGDGPPVVHL